MLNPGQDPAQAVRAHIREHVRSIGGDAGQAIGIELASLVRMVATLFEAIATHHLGGTELSAARWRLLFLLLAEERRGNSGGVTPTHLSRGRKVSKNTISALLRGLEEQGLIQRTLDAADRRAFRIRLTDAGRALIEAAAPQHIEHLNGLLADLTPAEQAQLADLLTKLHRSLLAHGGLPWPGDGHRCPGGAASAGDPGAQGQPTHHRQDRR